MHLQWGEVAVEKTGGVFLLPNPLVLEEPWIAGYEGGGERHLREEDDGTTVRYHSLILFPQRLQWYHAVPFVTCGAVGQVTDDGVDALVGNIFHTLQAVDVVDVVDGHVVED